MTTYYVGSGGNDANDGLSWANRKLTLNGAEDIPVAAGDTVYVGPGTYRETLTIDVSGTSGNPITYIGDYTGANTDGTGGEVAISGSDNDQTVTRNNAIVPGAHNYRTFTGFHLLNTNNNLINDATGTHWTISQCLFGAITTIAYAIKLNTGATNWTISRSVFQTVRGWPLYFDDSSGTTQNGQHVIESCIFNTASGYVIRIEGHGGVTVRNCACLGGQHFLRVLTALPASYTPITVNNCIIQNTVNPALQATATGEIVEDYNNFYANQTDRSNVSTGANSTTYPTIFDARPIMELLHGGSLSSIWDLSASSSLVELNSGTGAPSADLRGTTVQGTYREWGPLEYDSTLDIEAGAGSSSVYRRVARLLGG